MKLTAIEDLLVKPAQVSCKFYPSCRVLAGHGHCEALQRYYLTRNAKNLESCSCLKQQQCTGECFDDNRKPETPRDNAGPGATCVRVYCPADENAARSQRAIVPIPPA